MNILVKKDNQTFGPHSREEIIEFIQSGELSSNDLGTLEGEENWESIEKLISLEDKSESQSSIYDQFEDDEVDYNKLKEWEDVFVDEETDEEGISMEEESHTEDLTPEPSYFSEIPSDQKFEKSNLTPPLSQSETSLFVESNDQDEFEQQTPVEPLSEPSLSLPPPPPPSLPPAPPSNSSKKNVKDKKVVAPVKDRISASHKIKGLNSKQTVIVVKGEGIFSKIYSTSLVIIILFVIVLLITVAGLIFAPDRVAPILKNIGVPSELLDSITIPSEKP